MADVSSITARAIVIHEDHILLIERWRGDQHYFSIPGGHIEPGETAKQAVVRELLEETTITIHVEREVFTLVGGDPEHHIFLAKYIDGHPQLAIDSEEATENAKGEENNYEPKWVDISELPSIELAPSFTKLLLLNALKNGFPLEPAVHVER